MSEQEFRVVTEGRIIPGYDRQAVMGKFAQLLKLQNNRQQLEQLFSGRKVILKKELTEEQATLFAKRVQAQGLACVVVGQAAPPVVEQDNAPPAETPPTLSHMLNVDVTQSQVDDHDVQQTSQQKKHINKRIVLAVFLLAFIGGIGYWGVQNKDVVSRMMDQAGQFFSGIVERFSSSPENESVVEESIAEDVVVLSELEDVVEEESIEDTASVVEEVVVPQPPVAEKKKTEPAKKVEPPAPVSEEITVVDEVPVAQVEDSTRKVPSVVAELLGKKKKDEEEEFFPSLQDTLRNGDLGPLMVVLPAGQFTMGDLNGLGDETEQPLREVRIERPFAVSMYEVTFTEFDLFARDTGRKLPQDQHRGRGNRPVINVSWDDANAYAKWLSKQTGHHYRLPTEAEWEYAARSGKETVYAWGNELGVNKANCKGCGSIWDNIQLSPIGSFEPNFYGLHDLHGNAWEWVQDCFHETYDGAPPTSQAWVGDGECQLRGLRGGSWRGTEDTIRIAKRRWYQHYSKNDMVGFRLVRDLVK